MNKKIKASLLGLTILCGGCTHTVLTCYPDRVQTAIIGGSNVTNEIIALAPIAAAIIPLIAAKAPTPATGPKSLDAVAPSNPPVLGSMDTWSLDIFGTTYISCGNQPPPQTATNTTPPSSAPVTGRQ